MQTNQPTQLRYTTVVFGMFLYHVRTNNEIGYLFDLHPASLLTAPKQSTEEPSFETEH